MRGAAALGFGVILFGGVVGYWPDPVVLPKVAPAPAAEVRDLALAALEEADAEVLAQLATAEDPEAPAAVAWVVLNRAGCRPPGLSGCRAPVLEVVRARRQFGTSLRGVWRAAWSPRGESSVRARAVVSAVLQGLVADPTDGATCFHRVGTWVPPWAPARGRWKVLGSHAFYRPQKRTVVKSVRKGSTNRPPQPIMGV